MEVETPAFAEFAGILLGDGHMARYQIRRPDNRIQIKNTVKVTLDSREKQYAHYVKDLMTKLFGRSPKIEKRPVKILLMFVLLI